MAEFKIDDAKLAELLGGALLSYLDEAKRDVLIRSTIQHLLQADDRGGYGDRRSPLLGWRLVPDPEPTEILETTR